MLRGRDYEDARYAYTKLADRGAVPPGYPSPADKVVEIDAILLEQAEAEAETARIKAEEEAAKAAKHQPLEEWYAYWAEEADKGNNPKYLANNPFEIETVEKLASNVVSYNRYYLVEDEYYDMKYVYSLWKSRRIQSMRTAVEGWDLSDFLADNSVADAPPSITGNGVWVIGFKRDSDILYGLIPLFFIADKPENARYLVYCAGRTVDYYGTYGGGTKGYSETLELVIVNRVSGQTVFQKTYTADPPEFKAKDTYDFYASVESTKEFLDDIFQQISNLYNAWQ